MTKSPRTVVARLENDQLCIHYKDYCLNISDMLLTSRTFDERRMHSKSIDLEQFIDKSWPLVCFLKITIILLTK